MIKVKLEDGAFLPVKAHETDSGFDIFCPTDVDVPACAVLKEAHYGKCFAEAGKVFVDTGVRIEIPVGYSGFIKSKSGLNKNYSLLTEGVIDTPYRGTIGVTMYNLSSEPYHFNRGEKIAQLVIIKISDENELTEVDELNVTDRGDNGFGSTGR